MIWIYHKRSIFALNSPLVYYTTDVEKKNNHKDVDSLYDV